MPPSNQLPAPLRYLKARLRPLTRPPVWGGAIFVSVVGLVAWEYSVNPDLLQSSEHNAVVESKSNNPSLSPEDSAIGADIDSSPVLARELIQASTPSITPLIPPKKTTTKDLLELGTEKPTSPTDTQSTPNTVSGPPVPTLTPANPFLVQAQNLLQTGQLYGDGTSLGNPYAASTQPNTGQTGSSLGSGLPAVANQNQAPNAPPLNQSPTANSASTTNQGSANALGQSFPAGSSSYVPQPNGISNSSTGYNQPAATNNTYPANSYSYPSGVQIAPSVAPYSAPPVAPTPISSAPYSTQPNQPTGSYPNSTVNFSGSSSLQQQPSQLQQYFTTPQINQRRPIGGQVNTFGNP